MAIRFLGEKPTPTRTTETRAVSRNCSTIRIKVTRRNWDGFAESWRQVIRASRVRTTAGRCGG